MKVAAILFLAAALGSAGPVRTHKSIQSRDGQNECDCSKSLYYEDEDSVVTTGCPAGYEKSTSFPAVLLPCRQVGCSEQDYNEAQCGAKPKEEPPKEEPPEEEKVEKVEKEETPNEETPKEETPEEETPKEETPTVMVEEPPKKNTCVEQPTKKLAAPSVKNACDCSKSLYHENDSIWVSGCLDGYERISLSSSCQQVGCSEQDYNECGAKLPQDAKPATDARI